MFFINLQRFAEGEGGAAGAFDGGQTGGSDNNIPVAGENSTPVEDSGNTERQTGNGGDVKATNSGEGAKNTHERLKFAELIKDPEYARDLGELVDKAVARKHAQMKTAEERYNALKTENDVLTPALDLLRAKYNVESPEQLASAILKDNDLIESEAIRKGIDPEEYRTQLTERRERARLMRENEELRRIESERTSREQFNADVKRMVDEANEFAKKNPDFDLRAESQNKQFLYYVVTCKMPIETAYNACHMNDIIKAAEGGEYSLHMLDEDMQEFRKLTVGSTAPTTPADGDVWFDTSDSDLPSLKRYSTMYTGWFEFAARLVMILSDESKAAYRAMGIKEGDRLQISGSSTGGRTVVADGYYEVLAATEDSMTVKCTPKTYSTGTNSATLAISRQVPDMDYVIEYNNRLWGYNNKENEIYSSELGNSLSWNNFSTDATASYALKVGTNGAFTAIVPFGAYLLFFKEKCVHKLYGAYPVVYQQSFDEISGVKEGCAHTVCPINGTLYYQGTDGIYAYSGAYPTLIGAPLGELKYCAGSSGIHNALYPNIKRMMRYLKSVWEDTQTFLHSNKPLLCVFLL